MNYELQKPPPYPNFAKPAIKRLTFGHVNNYEL